MKKEKFDTSSSERNEWVKIINEILDLVRNKIDSSDAKDVVFSLMFYFYLSQKISNKILKDKCFKGKQEKYYEISDDIFTPETERGIIEYEGFFIKPSEVFDKILLEAQEEKFRKEELISKIKKIFADIEKRAEWKPEAWKKINKILTSCDFNKEYLGKSVVDRNLLIHSIMLAINKLSFKKFDEHENDIFGDIYEYLLKHFASAAGKGGGGVLYTSTCF